MDHRTNKPRYGAHNPYDRSLGEGVQKSRLGSSPSVAGKAADQGQNLWARNQRALAEQQRRQEEAARARAREQQEAAKAKERALAASGEWPGASAVRASERAASRNARSARSTRRAANASGRRTTSTAGSRQDRVSVTDRLDRPARAATGRSSRNAIDARPTYAQSPRGRVERTRSQRLASLPDPSADHTRRTISSVDPGHEAPAQMPFQAVADQRGVPIATVNGGRARNGWGSSAPAPGGARGGSKVVVAVVAVIVLAVVVGLVLKNVVFASPSAEAPVQDQQSGQALQVSDPQQTAVQAEPVNVTLSFAGDCTLGTDESFGYGSSFNAAFESKDDPAWFFANVADLFAKDDLTVVNMEGTLTTESSRADKTFAFKGPAEFAQVLVKGNVDAASLANNHSRDYGEKSYEDTIANVEAAGVPTFGYDRIAYQDVKGVKVALIGTYVLDQGAGVIDSMVANIKAAQEEGAQIIAVYPHWGNELDEVPDSTQVQVAHAAVDAGATVVVGSHPHVIQGLEKYQGRYIVYSLGNFCFGGNTNPTDSDCMIFQQTFQVTGEDVAQDDQVVTIPCSVSSSSSINNYQPTPAEGAEKDRIQAKIDQRTAAIGDSLA